MAQDWALYARVSTTSQAEKGYSINDQINSAKEYALKKGACFTKEYVDDGYSGEFLERPALENLRNAVQLGTIKHIIILDPDRLSRNLAHQLLLVEEFEKYDTQLHFITHDYKKTPEGHLFFVMRTAFAEYEKTKIRERSLRGKKEKARQGKIVIKHEPYGFSWDAQNSTYLINEKEAEVIRFMYNLCLKNRIGSVLIGKELARRGIYNRQGKPFNTMFIYRVLTKELYCGTSYAFARKTSKKGNKKVVYSMRPKDEWVPIKVPEIISKEVWDEVQNIIKMNFTQSKRNTKNEYMLRSIIECGICGKGMVGSTHSRKHKNGDSYNLKYYTCITKKSHHYLHQTEKCSSKRIQVEPLEKKVWNLIYELAADTADVNDYLIDNFCSEDRNLEQELSHHEEQLSKLKHQQTSIAKWFREGILDSEAAENELTKISSDIKRLTAVLIQIKSEIKKQPILNFSVEDIIAATTVEQRRAIILKSGLKTVATKIGKGKDYSFKLRF